MEKDKLNRRRAFAESGADPKYKFSHIYCKRCGKKLYTPMPCREDEESWGVFAFVPLVIAYVHDCGWRTIRDGEFNGYYCCPDCLTDKDTDFREPVPSVNKALPHYKGWVSKMRKKYNYYDKDKIMTPTKDQQAQEYAKQIQKDFIHNRLVTEELAFKDIEAAWLDGYTAAEQSMWRSVKEELPEDGETVLLSIDGSRLTGYYDHDDELWQVDGIGAYERNDVSHWCKLPSLLDTNTEKK